VALARELSHLPVIADPSHGTGRRSLVRPLSMASLAAGAQGLMIEVPPQPATALRDGPQSLDFDGFARLMREVREARWDGPPAPSPAGLWASRRVAPRP